MHSNHLMNCTPISIVENVLCFGLEILQVYLLIAHNRAKLSCAFDAIFEWDLYYLSSISFVFSDRPNCRIASAECVSFFRKKNHHYCPQVIFVAKESRVHGPGACFFRCTTVGDCPFYAALILVLQFPMDCSRGIVDCVGRKTRVSRPFTTNSLLDEFWLAHIRTIHVEGLEVCTLGMVDHECVVKNIRWESGSLGI